LSGFCVAQSGKSRTGCGRFLPARLAAVARSNQLGGVGVPGDGKPDHEFESNGNAAPGDDFSGIVDMLKYLKLHQEK
jgi:hypothetical protein